MRDLLLSHPGYSRRPAEERGRRRSETLPPRFAMIAKVRVPLGREVAEYLRPEVGLVGPPRPAPQVPERIAGAGHFRWKDSPAAYWSVNGEFLAGRL